VKKDQLVGALKPAQKASAKADATTQAARAIIDAELAARIAKTNRLRAARLAQEVEEVVVKPKRRAAKGTVVA